jgi:hypothetical protein
MDLVYRSCLSSDEWAKHNLPSTPVPDNKFPF